MSMSSFTVNLQPDSWKLLIWFLFISLHLLDISYKWASFYVFFLLWVLVLSFMHVKQVWAVHYFFIAFKFLQTWKHAIISPVLKTKKQKPPSWHRVLCYCSPYTSPQRRCLCHHFHLSLSFLSWKTSNETFLPSVQATAVFTADNMLNLNFDFFL